MINCKKDEWNLKKYRYSYMIIYYVVNWNFKYKNFNIWLKLLEESYRCIF